MPRTSYAKAIWGFSYTFLTGILALGKSEKTGPDYPKIVCRATQKKSKPSPPHFTSSKALLYCQASLRVELYLFHRYLGMRKIWGKWTKRPYRCLGIKTMWGEWTQTPQSIWSKTLKVIQCFQLHFSHQDRFHSGVKFFWESIYIYLFHRHSDIRQIWGNWSQIPQIMCKNTQKVTQNFQLYTTHQMWPYSSAKAIWGLSYTCFSVFGLL